MLNISNHSIKKNIDLDKFKSSRYVGMKSMYPLFNRFLLIFFGILLVVIFLTWTQNITGSGYVTTLKPNQRPQAIESPIPGRIEKWYVKEGQLVKKGDTLLQISEVKSEYFDPNLLERTQKQVEAKKQAVLAYESKITSLDNQLKALFKQKEVKLAQSQNKWTQEKLLVISEQNNLEAAQTNLEIAQTQYTRIEKLFEQGLMARKDLETFKLKLQAEKAKFISQENKLKNSQNKVAVAELEIAQTAASFDDKIAKTQSERFTAASNYQEAIGQVQKLENTYTNYQSRQDLLYVRAPQDGLVNKTIISGIGETFKEGEKLISIVPSNIELAVETYVRPIDLPLIHKGEKVRVQFDGWPAIVFSGWESVSYGTYGALVVAIERNISANGKYRVLLAPDPEDHTWPEIRIGSGVKTIALLNDVPIWFEMWRQLNGFPPNFYTPVDQKTVSKK